MTEQEAVSRMVAPGTRRPGKFMQGVIQILITRACDNSCYACTQGSNLGGKPMVMSLDQFETAVISLRDYFGVTGIFGGNPAMHPKFPELCEILRKHIPKEKRGIWCNNPLTEENGRAMRETFNPTVSNLNCHLSREAYDNFKRWWPESMPFGVDKDSRHAPVHLAMKDVIEDEGTRWDLISKCTINQHWSALIGVFRGGVRAWFCEVAGAQAMLHEGDPDYPDTGLDVAKLPMTWWKLSMQAFAKQVRKHCHECAVPLNGYGELAMSSDPNAAEQTSKTHEGVFKPKRKDRKIEVITDLIQLGDKRVGRVIDYMSNAKL